MKVKTLRVTGIILFLIAVFAFNNVQGQQYNSDSWISKPHGTVTAILTYGERQGIFMSTFSLLPGFEFSAAAFIYNNDADPSTDDGYSTSLSAKYMFYENKAKTGGAAFKLGTGLEPGYLDGNDKLNDAFKTFWVTAPITIPFFNNRLSWDIMPGGSVTIDHGEEKATVWTYTYSTRLAWYPFNMKYSLVGEIFGAEGDLNTSAKYRVGLRWEPEDRINIALTYNDAFGSKKGAGVELGLMVFSPPFFGIGSIKDKAK